MTLLDMSLTPNQKNVRHVSYSSVSLTSRVSKGKRVGGGGSFRKEARSDILRDFLIASKTRVCGAIHKCQAIETQAKA